MGARDAILARETARRLARRPPPPPPPPVRRRKPPEDVPVEPDLGGEA